VLSDARDEDALAYAMTILAMVHQPLAVLDRELKIKHANEAFRALFKDSVPPELASRLGESETVVEGRTFSVERRVVGSMTVLALEDLTQQRETERALARHRSLFTSITDPVFSLDTEYRVLTWNPAAAKFLGYSPAEAIGKRIDELLTYDASLDRKAARERVAAGETLRLETRVRGKSGTWLEVLIASVAVKNDEGETEGYLSIMHDIYETKQLERQLREHARVVEEANRELDSFTYSVSHDLRAPLRAIDGFSRILVEDHGEAMGKEGQRLLEVIRKNTLQMGQLIDDLLSFARLGRKEIAVSAVDMKDLVIELAPTVLDGTEHRVIDLRVGALPKVIGDRALLRQVWLNLLSNAVKYTRKKERAVIEVSAESTDGEIVFKVADNGAGFDMAYYDKLFGVFQRLHRNTDFEGTGVGLALVQRIVRRHGGRVWAEGKEGEGATFWFAFPNRGGGNG